MSLWLSSSRFHDHIATIWAVLRGWKLTAAAQESRPVLTVPDKPSLVVLPFVNLSNDPAQEYFSEGITEDIITELSRFRALAGLGAQFAALMRRLARCRRRSTKFFIFIVSGDFNSSSTSSLTIGAFSTLRR